ncbi:unnamed protein product [Brugia timori]|uniref:Uncharacterized protein n=1 Tax=Brugia timori TaxID=42155 RepID=A0A0R3R0J1_9BILA|nr:unnamed protein product [Brugia timori]
MLKLQMFKIITRKTLVSFYVLIEIQQITASKCSFSFSIKFVLPLINLISKLL